MIETILALAILPVALPAVSLLILTLAALALRDVVRPACAMDRHSKIRTAVLVPAHNESVHLLPTIACLQAQLGPHDRLLVIADNCSDDTAALARQAGAQVLERNDASLRGKGYALAYGVDHLRADPPDVVLVVDADCTVSEGAVLAIAQRCVASGKPVQMLNLMRAEEGASRKHRILEFAMRMKNLVRPLGSSHLGQACHLMGTGMALPWALMSKARLATGHIAEDMQLGIELAGADQAPQFFPYAEVSSHFPTDTGVAKVQKSRWEHGHLAVIVQELPALAWAALRTRKPALLVMALDLLIPPVALYLLVLVASLLATSAAAVLWPVWWPAALVVAVAAALFAVSIGLTWLFFGRDLLSLRDLVSTPLYALWKLPVYVAYFLKRRSGWTRTQRQSGHP